MKIIYYSSHPNLNLNVSSGPGTHMREVIKAFENAGHEVVPVIMGGIESTTSQIVEGKGRKDRLKKIIPNIIWQSLKDLNLIRFDNYAQSELESIIEKEKPDLIYERAYYLMCSGVRSAKKHGVKHFLEINAPYPEEKVSMEGWSFLNFLANRREKIQCQLSNQLFTVSSALKSYLKERTKVAGKKIVVTPNAINPDYLEKNEELIQSFTDSHGISEDELIFGFVGSIFPYHGVLDLVDAFASLKTEDKRLIIVGDGAQLTEIKSNCELLGVSDRVIFTGSVPHKLVYSYIDIMDCCIMARSNWYGSPVKIFEYGAMNKLVIAPDNIPVRDVMDHGIHGLLISEDIEDLKTNMSRLAEGKINKNEMAKRWQKKVMENHTWEKVGKEILSHF